MIATPPALHAAIAGYVCERTELGKAAETYRLLADGRPTLYLKTGRDLDREHARLRWAAPRLPVPRVLAFAPGYLLLAELPGTPVELCDTPIADRVAHLADTVRHLHQLPITDCLFDARIATRLHDGAANVDAGLVDESDFDTDHHGRTAASVLAELRAWPSFSEDLVVTHGDFTFSNVFVNPTGLLDLGRLGIADRHQDLALALRQIAGDYGPPWIEPFLAAYGLAPLDPTRRAFFLLLDELF